MNKNNINEQSAGTAAEKRYKCSGLAGRTLLSAILILAAVSCKAQTKIGSITVSDSVAKEYFLSCYNHPDTIPKRTIDYYEPIHWNADHTAGYSDVVTMQQGNIDMENVDKYNSNLEKIAIGIYQGSYIVPQKPSEQGFLKWFHNSR